MAFNLIICTKAKNDKIVSVPIDFSQAYKTAKAPLFQQEQRLLFTIALLSIV